MQLPLDLPPSVFCKSKVKGLLAKVRYFLVAEISGGAENLSGEVELSIL
jgi:hypothetical protein